jgi:quercetin dioxygenase-like cupin family protein
MPNLEKLSLKLADGPDRGCVFETEDLQVMRIRLAPGEALPHHNANSNVLLVPLAGTVRFVTEGVEEDFTVGEAMSVPYDTPMDVSNPTETPAAFLVVKAPHPKSFA